MKITQIVATAANQVIGKDGQLPWHLKGDLAYFKKVTTGHPIIMGRKTFESIGRTLPGRLNVIVTRQESFQAQDALIAGSVEDAIQHCRKRRDVWGDEVFIIGGGDIYRRSLAITERVLLTRLAQPVDGDVTYPELSSLGFVKTKESELYTEGVFQYRFETWEREDLTK